MLGFLIASSFVRYRTAWALGNALEYPVWLVCGFLVPLSLFPGWVRPISWALAPTWGMARSGQAALGSGAVGPIACAPSRASRSRARRPCSALVTALGRERARRFVH